MAVRNRQRTVPRQGGPKLAPPKDPILASWAGHTQYRCPDCKFDTLQEGVMLQHLKMNHRVPLVEGEEVVPTESAESEEGQENDSGKGKEGQDPSDQKSEDDPTPPTRRSARSSS